MKPEPKRQTRSAERWQTWMSVQINNETEYEPTGMYSFPVGLVFIWCLYP